MPSKEEWEVKPSQIGLFSIHHNLTGGKMSQNYHPVV